MFATGNEIMAQIAQACESLGYELLENGIYHQEKTLVEFVHGNSQCYYAQTLQEQPPVSCESVDLLLLDMPIGQLSPEQSEMLFGTAEELVV